jgi:ArsR family transcriptional regulator
MMSSSPLPGGHADACGTPDPGEVMTFKKAVSLAATFKAVAEPNRLRLLSLIAAHQGAEACVCDLTEPVGLTQPTVSHHLKVLVAAGLLTRSTRGSWSFYAVVPGALEELGEILRSSIGGQQPPAGQASA